MASTRFYGKVGYGETVESPAGSGVYKDVITEVSYYGDIVRNSRQILSDQKVNDNLTVTNSISVVADAYANEHIFAIRYAEWQGALWIVTDVEVQGPRLLLRLGGVYLGRTTSSP
jgi:hypothetical protein